MASKRKRKAAKISVANAKRKVASETGESAKPGMLAASSSLICLQQAALMALVINIGVQYVSSQRMTRRNSSQAGNGIEQSLAEVAKSRRRGWPWRRGISGGMTRSGKQPAEINRAIKPASAKANDTYQMPAANGEEIGEESEMQW